MNSSPPPEASPRDPLARRWWLNLVLLVVVAGLGVFAWYRSTHAPGDAKPLLTDLKPDSVQTVKIARPGEPEIRLVRHDGDWRLAAPIGARADAFAVKSLLRILQAPVESSVTPGDANLARYGLDPPKLTVQVDAATIEFGERHPLKDQQYVRYGSAVRLVSGQYFDQASAPYANLIDSRLIAAGHKLVSIALPDFALALKDGRWEREPPIEALSSDRINAFVDEWQHARALQVQEHAGGEPVRETVAIGFAKPGGGKLEIGVLARKPELILFRPDENLEYHLPADMAQRLLVLKAEDAERPAESENHKKKD